jgi:nucleotidyltransferase substrate binding protein (TIGR01987 family)
MGMLDLSSIRNAIASMERAWAFAGRRINADNLEQEELEVLRAAVIQNFEFTYELCWKFMKRWLEANLSPGLLDGVSRKQLFRYAVENHLIVSFDVWTRYHELRNQTAHTYDSSVAEEIFKSSGDFLHDAKACLNALEARND